MEQLNLISVRELVDGVQPATNPDNAMFAPGAVVGIHGAARDLAAFGVSFAASFASDGCGIWLTNAPHSLLVTEFEAASVTPNIFINEGELDLNFGSTVAAIKAKVDLHGVHLIVVDARHADWGLNNPAASVLKRNLESLANTVIVILHSEKLLAVSSIATEAYELARIDGGFALKSITGGSDKEFM